MAVCLLQCTVLCCVQSAVLVCTAEPQHVLLYPSLLTTFGTSAAIFSSIFSGTEQGTARYGGSERDRKKPQHTPNPETSPGTTHRADIGPQKSLDQLLQTRCTHVVGSATRRDAVTTRNYSVQLKHNMSKANEKLRAAARHRHRILLVTEKMSRVDDDDLFCASHSTSDSSPPWGQDRSQCATCGTQDTSRSEELRVALLLVVWSLSGAVIL